MKHYICKSPNTTWKQFYVCEMCLETNHSDLKKDWYIFMEETEDKKCESVYHSRNLKTKTVKTGV